MSGTADGKLLTFAFGPRVEYYDAPAIRRSCRQAKADDFRSTSISWYYQQNRCHEELIMILRKSIRGGRSAGMGLPWRCHCWSDGFPRRHFGQDCGNPVRRLGFVFMPMDATSHGGLPPARTPRRAIADPQFVAPVQEHVTAIHHLELQNAYPRQPCDSTPILSAAKGN